MLALDLNKLGSTLIRKQSSGETMTRLVSGPLAKEDGAWWNIFGQALTLINDFGAKMTGSLLKSLAGLGWSAIIWILYQVPVFVRGVWSFNWNATDEALDQYWANYVNSLAGLAGGVVGNAIGWLVCGAVPGLFVAKFNKVLGMRILKEVGEEALDELTSNLWNLGRTTARGLATAAMINLYKGTRRAIKKLVGGDSDWAKGFSMLVGQDGVNAIKKWGEKGTQPWSFAKKQEDFIESFTVQRQENFVEELIEEFQDSCEEAWYVVAATTDQWLQEQRFAREGLQGPDDVVEIYPNRENEETKIILAGPQELLKPAIVNTITNYQLFEERNIGNFMGETISTTANRETRTIMAKLIFSSSPTKKQNITTVTLYNVDKNKLDWADLKAACGGVNGYMWGPWQVNGFMDDENLIRIWANSEEEGWDRVQALSKFVSSTLLVVNAYHEMKELKRKEYDTLYKTPRRQYPWEIGIINPQQILNEENGKSNKKGIYKDKDALLPLWTDTKPDDWESTLTDLFATPGPDGL